MEPNRRLGLSREPPPRILMQPLNRFGECDCVQGWMPTPFHQPFNQRDERIAVERPQSVPIL